jgi:hypothetical protein
MSPLNKPIQLDNEDGVPITIQTTVGMRRRLSYLCELGIFGTTVEEVCERLVCRELQEMFLEGKLNV